MEQNKVRTYLLYALGEITLVVFGILIALQINNWNEKRKILNSEQEILENLKSELITNREGIEEYHKIHLNEYRDGIYLLNLFGKDISKVPVSRLDSLLSNIEGNWTFEASDGYIKSLISSGKIDHIQNTELKSMLTSFEGYVIDATQENIPVQRLLHENFWPAVDGKLSALNRLRSYEEFEDFPSGTYSSDYEWFFSDREMEDLVANIISWKKSVTIDEQMLKSKIDRMILLTENEINN